MDCEIVFITLLFVSNNYLLSPLRGQKNSSVLRAQFKKNNSMNSIRRRFSNQYKLARFDSLFNLTMSLSQN